MDKKNISGTKKNLDGFLLLRILGCKDEKKIVPRLSVFFFFSSNKAFYFQHGEWPESFPLVSVKLYFKENVRSFQMNHAT